MCLPFHAGITVTGPHIDMDLFRHIADEVFPFVGRFQPTVSGEPLMSKGLPEKLDLAEQYGVKVEMFTNATFFDHRMIEKVIRSLGLASISFDGATKETFEAIRAGAEFEVVVRNIRRLCAAARALPEGHRPVIGIVPTLMRANIEELPALVDLAADLGVDFIACHHMHPITEEMNEESLALVPDLAREWIERALARAEEVGMPMSISPLDQIVAATARSDGFGRVVTTDDGVLLERRAVLQDRIPLPPRVTAEHPEFAEISQRRAAGQARWEGLRPVAPDPSAPDRGTVWGCEFLWSKLFVAVDGDVTPCCVPNMPVLGNLGEQSFEEVWNGTPYRAMRESLVRKHPVPVCKGCEHIVEVADPALVHHFLQGREVPTGPAGPVPETLSKPRGA